MNNFVVYEAMAVEKLLMLGAEVGYGVYPSTQPLRRSGSTSPWFL